MLDKELFKLLGKNKKYIVIVVILMILGLFCNLAFVFSICFSIEIVINSLNKIYFLIAVAIGIIALIIRYITTRITGEIKDILGRNVKKDLRLQIYNKINKLGSQKDLTKGALTQLSLEGIEQLDLYYCDYIPQFFYAMIAPFILFFATVWLNYRPALALILLVPFIPLSIIAVSKYAKKIFGRYWGKYTSMGDSFLDSLQGLKELKVYQADEKRNIKMNESAEEFRKITMKVLVMQLASSTIMDTIAYGGAGLGIVLTILTIINKWSVYENSILSIIPASLFIILVSVDFFLPMRRFGSSFHIGMNGASAGKKIIALLNKENPTWGNLLVEEKDIIFNNVTFTYDGKKDVLKNINLTFTKGMNGIVGVSGSGKSTIVSLILGEIRASTGLIYIGNKKIDDLSKKEYYESIAVVSYNTYIFNESIRDNFKISKSDVTDQEIYEALKKVNLDEFVINNGGLDKLILEDSENISGGQRQRLALAINLITDKDIYIFDEATSNIDVLSEKIIMENIKKLSENKICIVISHRLANVSSANVIYYLADGTVKEKGTHELLMNNNKNYYKLYKLQKNLEEGYKEVLANEN